MLLSLVLQLNTYHITYILTSFWSGDKNVDCG